MQDGDDPHRNGNARLQAASRCMLLVAHLVSEYVSGVSSSCSAGFPGPIDEVDIKAGPFHPLFTFALRRGKPG